MRNTAVPATDFAANHEHVIAFDEHRGSETVAEISAFLGIIERTKTLSAELMSHAKDYALSAVEKISGAQQTRCERCSLWTMEHPATDSLSNTSCLFPRHYGKRP